MLSRFAIAFLWRSKCLLISWLQSPFAAILESRKIKSVIVSIVSPSICHEVMRLDAMILGFWMLSFKQLFHSPFSPSSRVSLVPLCFLPSGWCPLPIWGYWYFSWQSWFSHEHHPAWHFAWCILHINLEAGTSLVSQLQCGRPWFYPWLERSPGEGNGYLLQYSDLENSMDCIVCRVAKSKSQLSDFH